MARRLSYWLIGLLISCASQDKSIQTADTLAVTTSPLNSARAVDTTSIPEEKDCVFDNDYKGQTLDWLVELKITEFSWRDDLKQALVPDGQDTVFFPKGGCTHSGLFVEVKLTNDDHPLKDSSYWIEKALTFSVKYHMDYYEQMIRERKIKKAYSGETNVWYEIEDNNAEDNLTYNGIEITQDGRNIRINISQYFN
jgi:hypothetical protein